jgi:hypothetical protein
MLSPETQVLQDKLDEWQEVQRIAYGGGWCSAEQLIEPSYVENTLLETLRVTQIEDSSSEEVDAEDDYPILNVGLPLPYVKGYTQSGHWIAYVRRPGLSLGLADTVKAGLNAPLLGLADTVKHDVPGSIVGLSAKLRQRIKELSELPDGWDGDRAKPMKTVVLSDVVMVLKWLAEQPSYNEPFLVPTFDGLVQMEWHGEKRLLEIEAVEEGWAVGGTEIGTDRQRTYFDADCGRQDFEKLRTFYDWFSGQELIWPSL